MSTPIVKVIIRDPTPPTVAKVIVRDPAPGSVKKVVASAGQPSPVQFPAVAAAVLSSNCWVAFNGAGELIRADASLGIAARGLVKSAAEIGARCTVFTGGVANGFSGLTPNELLFLSTAGQATQTPPATGLVQAVAWAFSGSQINIEIQPDIELA